MKKLSTLKREAQAATSWRGHRMQWDTPSHLHGSLEQSATCRRCGCQVQVIEKPAPNEIDIGGDAVSMGCHNKA